MNISINALDDPINKANIKMKNRTPYSLEQIFTQVCEYKVFLVNLKREVLLRNGNQQFIKNVCLINSDWFNKWKKISCYEAIKDELNMCDNISTNYQKNVKQYIQILNNLEMADSLDVNIDNNSIGREYNENSIEISPESNFDIISPELWNNFTKDSQINNGTKIEIEISYITKDSFEIKLGQRSTYIIFWNINEQRLGKIILKYNDEGQKYFIFEEIKNLGINNFYACHLDDLVDFKQETTSQYSFYCINKSEFKKNIIKQNINYNVDINNNNYNINPNYFNNNISLLPMGLENVFLTCYMNSSLQSLVNVTKLSNYFTNNIFDENNQVLSAAYSRVVKNLLRLTPESQNMTYYSPVEFFQITRSLSPIFQGLAGDAIDLINFFLEHIHQEVNLMHNENVFTKYIVQNIGNSVKFYNLNMAINNYCQNNRSIMSNLFYYIEKAKTTCNKCKQTNYSFQFEKTLVFPLEEIRKVKSQLLNSYQNTINIMDGFDYHKRNTLLTNENMIYCNFCQMKTNAWQMNALYSAPEYLIINLNRGKGKSLNVHIDIYENININNYVESKCDNNNNYRLISLITHLGISGTAGHYIAFCFVEREKDWFKFNDTIVEKSTFNEAVNTGDSYVLIYQRI